MQKDKMAVVQVIGCLIKKPMMLLEDNYSLTSDDFPERFHSIIYGAIEHLIKNGLQELNYITIDDFLSKYDKQYKIFTDNKGIEYIQNAVDMSDVSNFEYYYTTLKKFSLLNKLENLGFDIKKVYDSDIINPEDSIKMQSKFDDYKVEDIINTYDKDLLELKEEYCSDTVSVGQQAAKGMSQLKDDYKKTPEMGMPLASKKLTTLTRGARLKKLYLKSAPSGAGKTRVSVGDACAISIPEMYDIENQQWVITGCQETTLFITTELETEEIQTMIMAYVSGVDESKILDGKYTGNEEERVDKAIEIIDKSPLYIEHIPNFNIDDIERLVKKYKYTKNIGYVFFDYVFISIKIIMEMATKSKGVKLREDNVLLMFIDRMKILCNNLNIHFNTSSQVNGDYKNVKDGDQNLIRGAKSMAD